MVRSALKAVSFVAGALALVLVALLPSGAVAMDAEAFREAVAQRLPAGFSDGAEGVAVRLDRNAERQIADGPDLTIHSVEAGSVDGYTGATRLVVQADTPDGKRLRLAGFAYREVDALAPTRALAPGEALADALAPTRVPSGRAEGLLRPGADLTDLVARRRLPEGTAVRAQDAVRRSVVLRNTLVTILWDNGAIVLTARGRSLGDGAVGDRIRVLNTDSKKTVEAVVVDAQTVSVSQP